MRPKSNMALGSEVSGDPTSFAASNSKPPRLLTKQILCQEPLELKRRPNWMFRVHGSWFWISGTIKSRKVLKQRRIALAQSRLAVILVVLILLSKPRHKTKFSRDFATALVQIPLELLTVRVLKDNQGNIW